MSVLGLMPPRPVKCYYTKIDFGLLLALSFCKRKLYNFRDSLSNIDRWQFDGIFPQVYLTGNFSPHKWRFILENVIILFFMHLSQDTNSLVTHAPDALVAKSGLLYTLSGATLRRQSLQRGENTQRAASTLREAKNP
jgi:hypothetical protein